MMATLVFETDQARTSVSLQANEIAETVNVRLFIFEKHRLGKGISRNQSGVSRSVAPQHGIWKQHTGRRVHFSGPNAPDPTSGSGVNRKTVRCLAVHLRTYLRARIGWLAGLALWPFSPG